MKRVMARLAARELTKEDLKKVGGGDRTYDVTVCGEMDYEGHWVYIGDDSVAMDYST